MPFNFLLMCASVFYRATSGCCCGMARRRHSNNCFATDSLMYLWFKTMLTQNTGVWKPATEKKVRATCQTQSWQNYLTLIKQWIGKKNSKQKCIIIIYFWTTSWIKACFICFHHHHHHCSTICWVDAAKKTFSSVLPWNTQKNLRWCAPRGDYYINRERDREHNNWSTDVSKRNKTKLFLKQMKPKPNQSQMKWNEIK